jgi:hypothetical protein
MQQQNIIPTAPQSQAPVTQKLSYAPPMGTFVPLKPAEALVDAHKSMKKGTFAVPIGCC